MKKRVLLNIYRTAQIRLFDLLEELYKDLLYSSDLSEEERITIRAEITEKTGLISGLSNEIRRLRAEG
jgi:hypothetical protein